MEHVDSGAIPSDHVIDVAIIGGGAAGAYCGYRLMKADPQDSPVTAALLAASGRSRLDVRIFENSGRIGGRLWSYRFAHVPSFPAELGGMAFNDSMQNVYGLATSELHLDVRRFKTYDKTYLNYLRRHRFDDSAYTADPKKLGKRAASWYPREVPYFLDKEDRWQAPGEILVRILKQSLPAHIRGYADEWFQLTGGDDVSRIFPLLYQTQEELRTAHVNYGSESSLKGEPFNDTGLWNLLHQTLGVEAYYLVYQAGGINTAVRNWNLYDAFFFHVMFGARPFYTPTAGYDTVPKTLVERFHRNGGHLHLRQRLLAVTRTERDGEQLLQLVLASPGSTARVQVLARNVILALPQYALENLDSESVIFDDPQFRLDLKAVASLPSSKAFMTYDHAWWRKVPYGPDRELKEPIVDGRSVTDLPMRQCLYVGNEPDDGPGLLMASYNDGPFAGYWDGYLHGSQSGQHSKGEFGDVVPPRDMLEDLTGQLKEVHGFNSIPLPQSSIFHDWMAEPFGGAWHFWNPHVRSWEVLPRIQQPVPGCNAFVCGESFSNQQGWVEGALNTAEMVLERFFGLARPAWVVKNYRFDR